MNIEPQEPLETQTVRHTEMAKPTNPFGVQTMKNWKCPPPERGMYVTESGNGDPAE